MEKITKGAVKNGEQERDGRGGRRESKLFSFFFFGICCHCSSLRIEGLLGCVWTGNNQNPGCCFGTCSHLIGKSSSSLDGGGISEDVMNLNCLCVGGSHHHSRLTCLCLRACVCDTFHIITRFFVRKNLCLVFFSFSFLI